MATKQKAAPSRAITPEVLGPDEQERGLVQTEGQSVLEFLGSLVPFFAHAGALERRANELLTSARALVAPRDGKDDAGIQQFIRNAGALSSEVETHWSITAKVSAFHRRLTTARGRATQAIDQAKAIAQGLHNTYVEAERRRAREAQERLRREEQERAEAERQRELDRLEAEAVKAEEGSANLSDRERHFVEMMANGYNTAQSSARAAGFKDPIASAARLMTLAKIKTAIEAMRTAKTIREQAAAKREMPIEVAPRRVVEDIIKAGSDRTYWGAEVFDPDAFMAALLDPVSRTRLGIPSEVATFDQSKLNELAKSLHELIDRWPGVRHTKRTITV